jgi:hypothetical protein
LKLPNELALKVFELTPFLVNIAFALDGRLVMQETFHGREVQGWSVWLLSSLAAVSPTHLLVIFQHARPTNGQLFSMPST